MSRRPGPSGRRRATHDDGPIESSVDDGSNRLAMIIGTVCLVGGMIAMLALTGGMGWFGDPSAADPGTTPEPPPDQTPAPAPLTAPPTAPSTNAPPLAVSNTAPGPAAAPGRELAGSWLEQRRDQVPDLHDHPGNGVIRFQAEGFHRLVLGSGVARDCRWFVVSDGSAHRGVYLTPLSGSDGHVLTDDETVGPALVYRVNVAAPGRWRVWVRMRSQDDFTDSVHIGLNGHLVTRGGRGLTSLGRTPWRWWSRSNHQPVILDVPEAGVHEVWLWMRENGTMIDAFWLTQDLSFDPNDATIEDLPPWPPLD